MSNFEWMVRLNEFRQEQGYKNDWLYHKFLVEHPEEVSYGDMEAMGRLLGYKKGWAYYKYDSFKQESVKAKKAQKLERAIYLKSNQHSQGKDLVCNVKF